MTRFGRLSPYKESDRSLVNTAKTCLNDIGPVQNLFMSVTMSNTNRII